MQIIFPAEQIIGHFKKNYRLFTVLFFRKIIEIERFALGADILHECQNY